jgi:hypothetical protein
MPCQAPFRPLTCLQYNAVLHVSSTQVNYCDFTSLGYSGWVTLFKFILLVSLLLHAPHDLTKWKHVEVT